MERPGRGSAVKATGRATDNIAGGDAAVHAESSEEFADRRAESSGLVCLLPSEDFDSVRLTMLLLLTLLLLDCLGALGLNSTRWPLYPQKPLLLAWNAPTEHCGPYHGIRFQLDNFQIVASPNEGFVRQNLTIFYRDRLGLYPYYDSNEMAVNSGLPQLASLEKHLGKMQEGVQKYIKDTETKGLAVIDWEDWRPLWVRNWDTKDIYRKHSLELVKQKNPQWHPDKVSKTAQQEFERSAKKYMLETLKQAKHLRPNQLWGFYLFPDCYNHNYMRTLENYTGRCPDVEMARNEQLRWLWAESTALFPSIYIGTVLRSRPAGRHFVRNRVKEGMRLASSGEGLARPVFVYTRPTYTNSLEPLTEYDLVSTIGESVALGAAGIIMWGDAVYASNKTTCSNLNVYLQTQLSQYLLNVSTAAELCSRSLCAFHGRCLRKIEDSDAYLHLSPRTHSIHSGESKPKVEGELDEEEKTRFKADFQCQCYSGYEGEHCERSNMPSQAPKTSPLHFVILLVLSLHLCEI